MVELRENEKKTLLTLKDAGGRMEANQIAETSGLAHAAVMRAALSLEGAKLVKTVEKTRTRVSLNEEGKSYAERGLPERRLANALIERGGEAPVESVLASVSMEKCLSTIALGWLSRKGWARIDKETQKLKLLKKPQAGADERLLALLSKNEALIIEDLNAELKGAVPLLQRRNIAEVHEESSRMLELTEDGWSLVKKGIKIADEISQITPGLIVSGKWREANLLRYNITAPVAPVWPGKKHPYLRFLDELKEKLIALGFKEMTGPIVELGFFNCDGLYMPQDHPAREIHDMYLVKEPEYGSLDRYKQILENVKKTHEDGWKTGSRGWGYSFSLLMAARLMLRSQTTPVSARTLISDKLEVPSKYFAIARCYRPDVVDRTHLTEFNQVEGIVIGEDLTLRDLLGVLERFALDISAADKVRYRPDYYPFTEPSVELSAYKEGIGWLEFGGSGIFRPEVTLPLGIEVPVLAWGLGVDRLFMMKAGIDDIRYLFTQDLDWMRRKEMI